MQLSLQSDCNMGIPSTTLQAQIVALLARKSALSAIVSGPRHAYTVSIYTVCHDKAAAQSLKQFKLDKTHVIAGSSLNASVEEAL